jgi:hypothetical protein
VNKKKIKKKKKKMEKKQEEKKLKSYLIINGGRKKSNSLKIEEKKEEEKIVSLDVSMEEKKSEEKKDSQQNDEEIGEIEIGEIYDMDIDTGYNFYEEEKIEITPTRNQILSQKEKIEKEIDSIEEENEEENEEEKIEIAPTRNQILSQKEKIEKEIDSIEEENEEENEEEKIEITPTRNQILSQKDLLDDIEEITYKNEDISQSIIKAKEQKKKWALFLIDFPWKYQGKNKSKKFFGQAPYPCMSFKELANLPIHQIMEDECIMLIWCTSPKMMEVYKLAEKFELKFVTVFLVWLKIRKNTKNIATTTGNYTRGEQKFFFFFIFFNFFFFFQFFLFFFFSKVLSNIYSFSNQRKPNQQKNS